MVVNCSDDMEISCVLWIFERCASLETKFHILVINILDGFGTDPIFDDVYDVRGEGAVNGNRHDIRNQNLWLPIKKSQWSIMEQGI